MPKCKHCKAKFEPIRFNQKYCFDTPECVEAGVNYAVSKVKKDKKKAWNERKAKIKEELRTNSFYMKKAQKVFNEFVRLRDQGKKCISCPTVLRGKYDAGHYYPSGTVKILTFNEDNVWGQCTQCNQHNHGNLAEYRLGLIERIGIERVEDLDSIRNRDAHYSIPDLKEIEEKYKQKAKQLK